MTVLNLIYCLVGGVFIVLGAACLWEKYRYCLVVEFTDPAGIRHTAATNDSFWFDQSRRVGNVIEIWYNHRTPTVVERRSAEAEILGVLCVALGFGVIFWLGLR